MSEQNNRPRISLRDVARQVGVSHVTVSLALRGDQRISEARRTEIQAVAKKMGYTPDPMLASLSAYRQTRRAVTIRSTIVWLNQWKDPKALRRFHEFEAYWRGAKETADQLGYRLEEIVLGKDISPSRLQKILTTRNVRGILIPPHPEPLDLPGFDWSQFSAVRFGASVEHPRVHIVTSDQAECAMLAFSRLHERGFARIGYISSIRSDRNTKGNFRAGFLNSQDALIPRKEQIPPLLLCDDEQPNDREALRKWLSRHKPDAIVTTLSYLWNELQKLSIRVPQDLAVATLSIADGNFDSGVDQNSVEIGRVAMRTLAGLIQQNEKSVPEFCRRILVEGRWVDGTSVPMRAATKSAKR